MTESFECVFPQSGEVSDRSSRLAMNRQYPGDWSIRLPTVVVA